MNAANRLVPLDVPREPADRLRERYEEEVRQVCDEVRAWLEERGRESAERLAVVLDVDETCLASRPALGHLDFAADEQAMWREVFLWMARSEGRPIGPVLDLTRYAAEKGFALFFVSGRPESLREATERNLLEAGFPAWEALLLQPDGTSRSSASDHKVPARRGIEADGFRIVANIGDQQSDLEGGHAERTFKVPNPYYVVP